LASLAANIAANHPKHGLCQLGRLRGYAIPDRQLDMVTDITRYIRDEAGQMLDCSFDEQAWWGIWNSGQMIACEPAVARICVLFRDTFPCSV
jgi:hypothetical protein